MTDTREFLVSDVTDVAGVPLGAPVVIDGTGYARIMRRIGLAEGELGTSVSAFNSSI